MRLAQHLARRRVVVGGQHRQALAAYPARADAADIDSALAEGLSQSGQGTGLIFQSHGELLRHRLARTI
jgi:hypothetical protein